MPPRQRLPPAIPPDSVYIPRRIIPLKDESALSVFGLDAHSILHSRPARKVEFDEQCGDFDTDCETLDIEVEEGAE